MIAAQAITTDGAEPRLLVSVLGGARFSYAGREIDLRNRKARAIFSYLALTPTGEDAREKLAGLFWSEFSEGNARATLRQAIHEFREALQDAGCSAMSGTRMTVGLRAGSFTVDLDDILAAVAAHEAPDALLRQERLSETLLAGFDDLDPSFHIWLMARRQALHDRLTRDLEAGYRDVTVAPRRRRRLAQATLLLDPTHEEACRIVMRCAAEAGETSAAIRAYDELYRLLDEEYDMEPSIATQELIAAVKQGKLDAVSADARRDFGLSYAADMRHALVPDRWASPAQNPPPVAPKPALFVDRFAMNGVDPDNMHLVDGFRVELLACLTRFREWYVASRELPETEGGRDMRVSSRYGVTTTVYQAGAALNVVMVLEERPSGLAIWGERFELRLDQWFEVQRRIVRRVAATLNVQLSMERLERVSHMSDVAAGSYDAWLRGQRVIHSFDAREWNRTVQMFAHGIEQTPSFSPLYSGLAQMGNAVHFLQPGMFRDQTDVARTLSLAQKAVALDPLDSRAELCLGWALAFSKRYGLAKIHMDIACELNGNDPGMLISAAMFHAFCGDAVRAEELSALALETALVPMPRHWIYEVSIRYLRGDDGGTVEAVERAGDALLTLPAWRAAALANLGRIAEAREEMERFYQGIRANWINDEPATEGMIARWFLHLYPISQLRIWKRLLNGLVALGVPIDDGGYNGASDAA